MVIELTSEVVSEDIYQWFSAYFLCQIKSPFDKFNHVHNIL